MFVGVHHSFVIDDSNDWVDYHMEELEVSTMNASAAGKDMLRGTFGVVMDTDAASHIEKEVGYLGIENNKHSPKRIKVNDYFR